MSAEIFTQHAVLKSLHIQSDLSAWRNVGSLNTVEPRYLEFQGTHWNGYPYLDISELSE